MLGAVFHYFCGWDFVSHDVIFFLSKMALEAEIFHPCIYLSYLSHPLFPFDNRGVQCFTRREVCLKGMCRLGSVCQKETESDQRCEKWQRQPHV
jgi:hypothetical protein